MSVRALIVCCVAVVGFVGGALAGYAAGRMMGGPPWGWGWGDWLGMGTWKLVFVELGLRKLGVVLQL